MKTDPQEINRYLTESRDLALRLVDAASILINETKDLLVSSAMRHAIIETATGLADAKHDLMHEIVRSEEMIEWEEYETVIGSMLTGINERISDARELVKRLILNSTEAAELCDVEPLLELVLAELELNIGDFPILPDCTQPTGTGHLVVAATAPDFHDLLVSDRHKSENEFLLECFTKDQENMRDITTSIIFGNHGFVIFRVIDDECRYSDDEYCSPFYTIKLYVIEPADREALFQIFLEDRPETEIERRVALVEALKASLKNQYCSGLLNSSKIRFREFRNTIHTS
jgi:hypothetical protein